MTPLLKPFAQGMLVLDHGHQMYWEQCGNPAGVPVVYLHGGPGEGSHPRLRSLLLPLPVNWILYDQRGAGRSIPRAAIHANTTRDLVNDLERLRRHLSVERMMLAASSWGSVVALSYALAYPDQVSGLVLRSPFLGSAEEIDWFMVGNRPAFPEAWHAFSAMAGQTASTALAAAYYRLLTSPDPRVHLAAAREWHRWETTMAQWPETTGHALPPDGFIALPLARLEAHYLSQQCFLPEPGLLERVKGHRVATLPCHIVHGSEDRLCLPGLAARLADCFSASQRTEIPGAGHSLQSANLQVAFRQAIAACAGLV